MLTYQIHDSYLVFIPVHAHTFTPYLGLIVVRPVHHSPPQGLALFPPSVARASLSGGGFIEHQGGSPLEMGRTDSSTYFNPFGTEPDRALGRLRPVASMTLTALSRFIDGGLPDQAPYYFWPIMISSWPGQSNALLSTPVPVEWQDQIPANYIGMI